MTKRCEAVLIDGKDQYECQRDEHPDATSEGANPLDEKLWHEYYLWFENTKRKVRMGGKVMWSGKIERDS